MFHLLQTFPVVGLLGFMDGLAEGYRPTVLGNLFEPCGPAAMLGRTFFGMHLIGFQKSITCILSDFKKMFSAFYRNSDIFTTFVSTI